jgi:hypothetical protein
LELLAAAGEADRLWILQKLSTAARQRLMSDEIESGRPAAPEPPKGLTPDLADRLERADPGALAELLRDEPPWLICGLLRAHTWSWSMKLVEALPSTLRGEVTRLGRQRLQLPRAAEMVVARSLVERLTILPEQTRAGQSPFESLLGRLGARRPR